MSAPSLLVVVQRYGDVSGGAERLARDLVVRLAPHLDVEVATTTSRDYWAWDDHFPSGEDRVDGVAVRRFSPRHGRTRDYRRYERHAFAPEHLFANEEAFIDAQGPYVPELLEFLGDRGRDYDHVLFFTYIYYPTVRGLPLVPERAVLVPTAHDEPALGLTAYRALFHLPRAIAYNTEEERDMVRSRFRNARVPSAIAGVGVDLPPAADGAAFRARHGVDGPLLLYVGRVVESKGCDELFEHFARWKAEDRARRGTLVVVGEAEMPVPRRDDVRALGSVSDAEKWSAYAACDAFVMPSRYESLSIVALEALAMGRPLVCSAGSPVLLGLSRRSGGGLPYGSYPEFAEICDLLLADADLRRRLGAAGAAYVASTHRWDRVVETYLDLFAEVRARNA